MTRCECPCHTNERDRDGCTECSRENEILARAFMARTRAAEEIIERFIDLADDAKEFMEGK